MKRREFVHYTSLAGGAFVLAPEILSMRTLNDPRISIQLSSVRDDMNSEPAETIMKLAKAGYREVEGIGYDAGKIFGLPATDFKELLTQAGMKMSTMHFNVGLTNSDSRTGQLNDVVVKSIAAFAKLGVEMIICPFILKAQRDVQSIQKLCHVFNRTGELCLQHGMKFGYHNSAFEFEQIGTETIYDMILQRTNPKLVEMQLDIYWAAYAGKNPVDVMKSAPGRITSLTIQDIVMSRPATGAGSRSINLPELLALDEAKSVKYYVVELEEHKTTPWKGMEPSYQNLKKLLSA